MNRTPRVAPRLALLLVIAAAALVPAVPAAASDLIVYGDSLNTDWENWSWDTTVDFGATSPVHSGSASIAATYDNEWAGLYLVAITQAIDSHPYDTVQFWIHGGSVGGQSIRLALVDDRFHVTRAYVDVPVTAGAWTQFKVPLTDLGEPEQIRGIMWLESAGGSQPTFYVDDVSLTNQGLLPPPLGPGPDLSVNAGASRHAISDNIYGINDPEGKMPASLATSLRLPVRRWGGNHTTRYNWQANILNLASDYYFENYPHGENVTDGSVTDLFVEQDRQTGTKTLLTLPLIGWTAKGSSPRNHPLDCGYKISKYGAQSGHDPYDPDCGNGISSGGSNITGNDPLDTSTAIGPQFVSDWIQHLTGKYGFAQSGGVTFYNLDNEPMLWNSTHRDVHPQPTTYDEVRDRAFQYAAAVKAADPGARTLGPVLWGWCAYFYSALDGCGEGSDYHNHGDTAFVPWYLQQMRSYELSHATRIVDYLDLHYSPQATDVSLAPAGSHNTQALRLRSTRSLWDPTYVDESWIPAAVRLIPRMKEWVDANYPGTKLAITEYNWGDLNYINGALAQADVLGIFGREGLDLATFWGDLAATDPGAFAFRIYRNYDGTGKGFGNIGVHALSADQDTLSVYAAQRSSDGALTIMVINKTAGALTSQVDLRGFTPRPKAAVYRYSRSLPGAIEHAADMAISPTGLSMDFPGKSITLLVLMPGVSVSPPLLLLLE
jgi:hypothetical protein